MTFSTRLALAAAALAASLPAVAQAPAPPLPRSGIGDLLVAPTRILLDGRRGAEVILNNIGAAPATYRISVEFRRMTADGALEDVADLSAADKQAQEMIVYAPRRITLAPNQPQSIRIAARRPQGLPDGEYRVHMLFRAIPPARPAGVAKGDQGEGLRFALIPVYGVTIPVIVRLGNLEAKAGIANVRVERKDGKPAIALDLSRSGTRSTFGEVRVVKAGVKDPIAVQRSVAVYTELATRQLSIPIEDRFKDEYRGPVTVQYVETYDDGQRTIAETTAVLR